MTKSFAAQIIDSMVDENGHCGDRGLSKNQFNVLSKNLEIISEEEVGGWRGDYGSCSFTEYIYDGYIDRYHVILRDYSHFNHAYSVVNIDKWCDEIPDVSGSEWQYDEKARVELELTLIEKKGFYHPPYVYGGTDWTNIYTFTDASNNVYVWKTDNEAVLELKNDIGLPYYRSVKVGDKVRIKGTVKEHNTYRDVKQTMLTRCKVLGFVD